MRVAIRAEDLPESRRWLIFAAIMLPYVFYAFCWNTGSFLHPYLADSLGLSRQQVASFYTLQGLGALIGAVLISPIADRYSRRMTLAILTICFGLASISSLYVFSYAAALTQRFAMGFFPGRRVWLHC